MFLQPTGKKLFGPGYSGLEYDYRGLIRLYINTNNFDKMNHYNEILNRWNFLREGSSSPVNIVDYLANYRSDMTTEEVIQKFFQQDWLDSNPVCFILDVNRTLRSALP